MATRTYEVQLIALVSGLYKYISRWQPKLNQHLTTPEADCVAELLTALLHCLTVLQPPPPDEPAP